MGACLQDPSAVEDPNQEDLQSPSNQVQNLLAPSSEAQLDHSQAFHILEDAEDRKQHQDPEVVGSESELAPVLPAAVALIQEEILLAETASSGSIHPAVRDPS